MIRWTGVVAATVLAGLAGCSHDQPTRPLTPAAFNAPARTEKPSNIDPLSGADQPGELTNSARTGLTPRPRTAENEPVQQISKTVLENSGAAGTLAAEPTTAPAPATLPTGQY